jgi:hypothetical protein
MKPKASANSSATPSNAAATAPPPLTFGSTSFLSELQNRRKHVMHDNSLQAGASDDDSDPPPAAQDKRPLAVSATVHQPASCQPSDAHKPIAEKSLESAQSALSAADTNGDKAAPDASTCLRRLDRLPSTVENCLKE